MINKRKQCRYAINIASIKHIFEIIRAILKLHIKVLGKTGANEYPIAPHLCVYNIFLLNVKSDSLVTMISKLPGNFGGILVAVV